MKTKLSTNGKKVVKVKHPSIEQGENQIKEALHEAEEKIHQGQEKAVKWASDVDKRAHANPWSVVASVGLGTFLLGLIIGKK